MDISKRIRELRQEKGMTVTELASAMGKSEGAVRMWETGKSKPDIDTIINLTKYFNVSSDYLLGIANVRNPENEQVLAETGLGEKAIEKIKAKQNKKEWLTFRKSNVQSNIVSDLIESKGFDDLAGALILATHPISFFESLTDGRLSQLDKTTMEQVLAFFSLASETDIFKFSIHGIMDGIIDELMSNSLLSVTKIDADHYLQYGGDTDGTEDKP